MLYEQLDEKKPVRRTLKERRCDQLLSLPGARNKVE
jgi:hypothetical protein